MKRIVYILLGVVLLGVAQSAWAWEQEDFYTPGKRWVVETIKSYSDGRDLEISRANQWLDKDSIINGNIAWSMTDDVTDWSDPFLQDWLKYFRLMYSCVDGKVVFYSGSYVYPLYDFNVTVGDRVPMWVSGEDFEKMVNGESDSYYEVIDDRVISLYGVDRRVLTLQYEPKYDNTKTFCWIEGIGDHSLCGRRNEFTQYYTSSYFHGHTGELDEDGDEIYYYGYSRGVVEVWLEDRLLYSFDDFENQLEANNYPLADIKGIAVDENVNVQTDTTLYDLMGRPVTGNARPGIYIRAGKKVLIR